MLWPKGMLTSFDSRVDWSIMLLVLLLEGIGFLVDNGEIWDKVGGSSSEALRLDMGVGFGSGSGGVFGFSISKESVSTVAPLIPKFLFCCWPNVLLLNDVLVESGLQSLLTTGEQLKYFRDDDIDEVGTIWLDDLINGGEL